MAKINGKGKATSWGREGHFYRTNQTSTEPPLWLEVGSMGWGMMRSRGVIKKKKQHRVPPNWVPGMGLGLLQLKTNQEIKSSLERLEPSGMEGRGQSKSRRDIWQLG